jgi:hypothetical protein
MVKMSLTLETNSRPEMYILTVHWTWIRKMNEASMHLSATRQAGPKINSDDVAPLYGYFKPHMREICTELYSNMGTICYVNNPLKYKCKKSITWYGGHHCMAGTSLQSGIMLDSNCPIPTSHRPHLFSKPVLFSPTAQHVWHNFSTVKMTSA